MQQLATGTLLQGGKYKIEEKIGQGGFGITYRACQPLMLGRKVCIKEFCLKQHFSRESTTSAITYPNDTARKDAEMFQQKFIKEAQTLYSMRHPNIMEIYDIFEENNTAYYVMEYIEGESLKDMLERRGCIPEAEAIGYIRKVAEALKYIHSRNINHFDVKPANILVRSSDKEVILIDFGTAKHYDSNTGNATTMTSGLLSPGYAPIEQYQQGGVSVFTPETDIYALGATLYKLLTGITPPEPTEIINNGIPELPSALSKSTKDLIKWAMQLNKDERPHTCDEFLYAMESNENCDSKNSTSEPNDVTLRIYQAETEHVYKQRENNQETEVEEIISESPTRNRRISKKIAICSIIVLLICIACIPLFQHYQNEQKKQEFLMTCTNYTEDSKGTYCIYDDEKIYVDSIFSKTYVLTTKEGNLKCSVKGVPFGMIKVENGTFTMGATPEMEEPYDLEKPTHAVTLTNDYYIGKTEVTQALWKAVMVNNPSYFRDDNLPVEGVSWNDCQKFISKLNYMTGQNFRLPTEAEWEFAARGGNVSKHYQYSGSNKLGDVAWYDGNSENKTHVVATKQANELGIYDMSGNVWEWCSDLCDYYNSSWQTNPLSRGSGGDMFGGRVFRGGSINFVARRCRLSYRNYYGPDNWSNDIGFRLALSK